VRIRAANTETVSEIDKRLTADLNESWRLLMVFDLDGTFAPTKFAIDPEMGTLLRALPAAPVTVAIISGGALSKFEKQVLADLPQQKDFYNSSLLPTCGTSFFRCTGSFPRRFPSQGGANT
jgi:hypothetical protein